MFYDWRSAVNPQCVYVLYSVSVCEFALVREETMYTVCYVPVRMHVSVCESSVFVWILQIDHSVFLGLEEYSTYVREKSCIRRFVPPDEDAQNPKTCLR